MLGTGCSIFDVWFALRSCYATRCWLISRMSRAGTPATTECGGTSEVTTAPAPMIAPSPIVNPHNIVAPLPIDARLRTSVGITCHGACSDETAEMTQSFVTNAREQFEVLPP